MLPTILAWIGIVIVFIWATLFTFGTYHFLPQFRQITIEKKYPKFLIFTSCSTVFFGFINLLLCILILILNFNSWVLVATIVLFGLLTANAIISEKRKLKNPNHEEDDVKMVENSTRKQRLLLLISILETLIMRLAPFVLFLILA